MVLFPTLCVDGFLEEPDELIRFAEQTEFFRPSAILPVLRSRPFSELGSDWHSRLLRPILTLLDSKPEALSCKARIFFQVMRNQREGIDPLVAHGGIHQDPNCVLAGVLYLTRGMSPECGTTIFALRAGKGPLPQFSHYLKDRDEGLYLEEKQKQLEYFEESIEFKNAFNRLILFDARQWHRANSYYDPKDRLVVVFFLDEFSRPPSLGAKKGAQ